MPRLFTGVEIPEDVAFDLSLKRGGILGARWIDAESYHITLRFIGDIDSRLANEISYELEGVAARPFTLTLKGIEVLGGNKPHTLAALVAWNLDPSCSTQHSKAAAQRGMKAAGAATLPGHWLSRPP